MPPIEWRETLSVGHEEIDAQHRRMVDLFNELHRAMQSDKGRDDADLILDELIGLAAQNFLTEEALMSAQPAGAGSFAAHRQIHRGLLQEMRMLREGLSRQRARVNANTVNFVRKWLFDHLTHSDRELVALAVGLRSDPGNRQVLEGGASEKA